jgi:hypothetical protein
MECGVTCRQAFHGCVFAEPQETWAQFPFILESETSMNEETFNLSIRKFLKMVGVNSQRDIEQAVAKAIATGAIAGNESFPAKGTLEGAGLNLNVNFDGEIKLE